MTEFNPFQGFQDFTAQQAGGEPAAPALDPIAEIDFNPFSVEDAPPLQRLRMGMPMSRPQEAAPQARPRIAGDIVANFAADWEDLKDGYKALGQALVDHGPGVLVDVAKHLPGAVWDSYARWVSAAKNGNFLQEIERHPLEFIQDVGAPLAMAFSGGSAISARFGTAGGAVAKVLQKAATAADALQIASEPLSGLALVGARRGLGMIWQKAIRQAPAAPRPGVDPIMDAIRQSVPRRPDFPVQELLMEQAMKEAGGLNESKLVNSLLHKPADTTLPSMGKPGEIRPEGATLLGDSASPTALNETLTRMARAGLETGEDPLPAMREVGRRGTVTQVQQAADALGVPADEITFRERGEVLRAEQIKKGELLVNGGAEEIDALVAAVRANPTEAGKFEVMDRITRLGVGYTQVQTGGGSEAGRSLLAWQHSKTAMGGTERALRATYGSGDSIDAMIETWAKMRDPRDKAALAAKVVKGIETRKPDWLDNLVSYALNWGMLSGLRTSMTNMASNSITSMLSIPEHGIAGAIGVGRNLVGGRALNIERELAPVWARTFGMVEGSQQGMRLLRHTLFTDEMPGGGKLEGIVKGEGWKQELLHLPGLALRGQDAFAKGVGYMQEMYTIAARRGLYLDTRQAAQAAGRAGHLPGILRPVKDAAGEIVKDLDDKPIKVDDFARYVVDKVKGLPENIGDLSLASANYQTFTNKLKWGSIPQRISEAVNKKRALKFFMPFVQTPWNIVEYAWERTPFAAGAALMAKNTDLGQALRGRLGQSAQNLAWGRIVLGSTVATGTAALAANGFVTGGGPLDSQEREALKADGWQPYSIRLPRFLSGPGAGEGDGWFSYSRLEPAGIVLGIAADMQQLQDHMSKDELSKLAALFAVSVTRNFTSKTWLKGLSSLFDVIHDPEQYLPTFVGNLAGLAVPNILNQTAQQMDPSFRQVRGVLDRVQQRVPGWRESLPVRVDLWGREMKSEAAGVDMFSPVYYSPIQDDPINKELQRIGVYPSLPSRNWGGLELNGDQYVDYQVSAGREAYRSLSRLVQGSGWSRLPLGLKQELAHRAITLGRKMGRTRLLQAHPQLLQDRLVFDLGRLQLGEF